MVEFSATLSDALAPVTHLSGVGLAAGVHVCALLPCHKPNPSAAG